MYLDREVHGTYIIVKVYVGLMCSAVAECSACCPGGICGHCKECRDKKTGQLYKPTPQDLGFLNLEVTELTVTELFAASILSSFNPWALNPKSEFGVLFGGPRDSVGFS